MGEEEYFAVHIPTPGGGGPPTGGIFASVQAAAKYANTPEAKARGNFLTSYFLSVWFSSSIVDSLC